MAFDSDAYLEALAPPVFKAGGREFRGRILSVPEWLKIHEQKMALEKRGESVPFAEVQSFVIGVVREMFPKKWYHLYNPVIGAFERMPYKAQLAALEDFCESQRKAMPGPTARDE